MSCHLEIFLENLGYAINQLKTSYFCVFLTACKHFFRTRNWTFLPKSNNWLAYLLLPSHQLNIQSTWLLTCFVHSSLPLAGYLLGSTNPDYIKRKPGNLILAAYKFLVCISSTYSYILATTSSKLSYNHSSTNIVHFFTNKKNKFFYFWNSVCNLFPLHFRRFGFMLVSCYAHFKV